jgi:hypothetical protein
MFYKNVYLYTTVLNIKHIERENNLENVEILTKNNKINGTKVISCRLKVNLK